MSKYADVILKKDEERRLLAGHLWIFSNEIDTKKTHLNQYQAGDLVEVRDSRGKVLGIGYINPHSLLAIRLLSHKGQIAIDHTFFQERFTQALHLRSLCFHKLYYRLVFGESDGLPGLVIDRFGDIYVMQITSAGMERLKEQFLPTFIDIFKPQGILLRNDISIRELEGLNSTIELVYGEVPDTVFLEENSCHFQAPVWKGQKTGWFYDHRHNRSRLQPYVSGKKVLDIFCYAGAWSIEAAKFGAQSVLGLDSSAFALACAQENAALNQLEKTCSFLQTDAFQGLENLIQQNEKFDLIIVDPPAFVKRKKDLTTGLQGYRKINELALKLLNPNGFLFTASCSSHVDRDQLLSAVRKASNTAGPITVIEQLHQAQDHPIHPAIPETEYLKGFICVKTNA